MDKFEACIRVRQALRDKVTREFLLRLLDNGITRIDPVFTPREGLRYTAAEGATGLDPKRTIKLLERLYQLGILEKVLHDKTVFCPDCGSPDISIHFNCPNCGSMDTLKLSLIEDLACGYIDKEERFRSGGRLMCPNCGRTLMRPGVDFRRVGIWYVCNSCGSEFDIPIVTYTCRRCSREFSMEEANYEPVYSFKLEETVKEVALIIRSILSSLAGLLRSRGFSVEAPSFVNGRSGEVHMFDLMARGNSGKNLVMDVFVADGPVPERVVTLMFAKLYDTAFSDAFLITIPSLREEGRRLAAMYRIHVIEGQNRDEVLSNFKTLARRGERV